MTDGERYMILEIRCMDCNDGLVIPDLIDTAPDLDTAIDIAEQPPKDPHGGRFIIDASMRVIVWSQG